MQYKGRFAPTPSGSLHLGSLFTALASFLEARKQQGIWTLRIDDIDPYRSRLKAVDQIRETLESLGLFWDGPVVRQSSEIDQYLTFLNQLDDLGLTYACHCSRSELAALSGTNESQVIYPGYCRSRAFVPSERPHSLRIRTMPLEIEFRDRLQGLCRQNLEREVGDFILYRKDKVVSYHLATIVDDAEGGITEVMRGVDLLDSTPRQIYLQNQLGINTPHYAHLPVLVDRNGKKLGKSSGALPAETGKAAKLLFQLLGLLEQCPPVELYGADSEELMAWAMANWNCDHLAGIKSISVDV